jgi:hypothetical protein
MDKKNTKKLRALVYVGLAGGLVGVSTMSAAAHGNASSHYLLAKPLTWQADDFVVDQKQQQPVPTR